MLTKIDLSAIKKIISDVVAVGVEAKINISEKKIEVELTKTEKIISSEIIRLEDMIGELEKKVDHEDSSLKKRLKMIEDHI